MPTFPAISLIPSPFLPDANAHNVFSLGRPVNLSVEILFNGLAALKWTNVVLLNTARCSWNQLPADIRTAVEVYSEQYNVRNSCLLFSSFLLQILIMPTPSAVSIDYLSFSSPDHSPRQQS